MNEGYLVSCLNFLVTVSYENKIYIHINMLLFSHGLNLRFTSKFKEDTLFA